MAWFDALAGVGDFAAKLFNTGYSLYQEQRDFQYQKDLQNQIFAREDNAVQRRMADLEAAGLNPNLAAGSAADAGTVVGRSNSKNVELGSALDTMAAYNQIQLQRQEKKNKEAENKILKQQLEQQKFNYQMSEFDMLNALGFNPSIRIEDGGYQIYVDQDNLGRPFGLNLFNLQRELNIQNLTNSSKMLQLDTDFYESNKWLRTILPVLNILGQGGKTAASFIRAFK